jgi:alkanesulfonate monooxygenase SsuD/methylene tetrahydromethanopterin reductase-like flavin-dependent oxidoreductase (luciferase family)
MQFGIFDHMDDNHLPLGQQIEERLRLTEAYDAGGFYAYHLAEHHCTPLGRAPSPSVFLAAVAQRTRRIQLIPLVYLLPLYHPIRLVEEICMLDHMSNGRFQLGIGQGASPIEVGFYGIDPTTRQDQHAEALQLIREGLSADILTHHGKFYHFDNVPMVLHPLQRPHPPLWCGIKDPETTAWAAANEVNIVSLQMAPMVRQVTDRYRAEWSALGKPDARIPFLGVNRLIVLAWLEEEARRTAQRSYVAWYRHMTLLWEAHSVPFPFPLPPTFDMLQQHGGAFAGTAAGARAYIAEQVETAGINYFVCDVAFGTMSYDEAMQTTDILVREVMPSFAGRGTDGTRFDGSPAPLSQARAQQDSA